MKRLLKNYYSILLVLVLFGVACDQVKTKESSQKLKFGAIKEGSDKKSVIIKETLEIQYGQPFGYKLQLPDNNIHEVYDKIYFPKPPKVFTGDLSHNNLNSAVSGVKSQPNRVTEIAQNFYWFDEGDPLGEHKLEIYIDNELSETINFNVIKTKDE